MDRHPSDDTLEQYSLGTLAETQVEGLEEHVLLCEGCQDRLQQTDAFVKSMRQAAAGLQLAEKRQSALWLWLTAPAPVAGMVVLLIALALLWTLRPHGSGPAPAPATVLLESTRGTPNLRAPAGTLLVLVTELRGLPALSSYSLEIVDAGGGSVFAAAVKPAGERVSLAVPRKLAAGTYWVRLYEPSPPGRLLREFGLEVTKKLSSSASLR